MSFSLRLWKAFRNHKDTCKGRERLLVKNLMRGWLNGSSVRAPA
jgi:hypothetical protein